PMNRVITRSARALELVVWRPAVQWSLGPDKRRPAGSVMGVVVSAPKAGPATPAVPGLAYRTHALKQFSVRVPTGSSIRRRAGFRAADAQRQAVNAGDISRGQSHLRPGQDTAARYRRLRRSRLPARPRPRIRQKVDRE